LKINNVRKWKPNGEIDPPSTVRLTADYPMNINTPPLFGNIEDLLKETDDKTQEIEDVISELVGVDIEIELVYGEEI